MWSGKKYRADYMEDAVTKYLTLCQTPEFAVRYQSYQFSLPGSGSVILCLDQEILSFLRSWSIKLPEFSRKMCGGILKGLSLLVAM